MTHPLPNLTTRADQIAHYAAVKRRIHMASARKTVLVIVSDEQKPVVMAKQIPLWQRREIYFDLHVTMYLRRRGTAHHLIWLRDRCKELGCEYEEVVGYSRKRSIIPFRFQLMWEMRTLLEISFPQIGRAFGGRDHSSSHHAYTKWQEKIDAESNAARGY